MKSIVNRVQQRDRRDTPLAMFAALALALGACTSSEERADAAAQQAQAYFEAGNLPKAYELAQSAVRIRDDKAEIWLVMGRINLAAGNVGDAYNAYTRALELDAVNVEALQITSEIALQAGRTRDAVRSADALLALQPGMTRPKLIKGFVALKENRLDDADKLADEILTANPEDEVGAALKARVLGKRNELVAAAAMLEPKADAAQSDILMTTLAEIYRKANDGPMLAKALDRLVRKAPNDDRVIDLAAVQYKLGNVAGARDTVFDYLSKHFRDVALHKRVGSFLIENDPNVFDGARIAQVAESMNASQAKLAAQVLLSQGRADDALKVLKPIYGPSTENDIKALYAAARARQGASAEAKQIIDDVIEGDESNAIALIERARLRLAARDAAKALSDAQLVLRDDPQSVDARLIIIASYRLRNEQGAARRFFEESIQTMPQSVRLATAYAQYLNQTKDQARAFQIAEAFTRLNPATIQGWQLLKQQCRTADCNARVALGLKSALTMFAAQDGSPFSGSGLFGQL